MNRTIQLKQNSTGFSKVIDVLYAIHKIIGGSTTKTTILISQMKNENYEETVQKIQNGEKLFIRRITTSVRNVETILGET